MLHAQSLLCTACWATAGFSSAPRCRVQNTLIQGNVVVDRGAGIFVEEAQLVALANVTLSGNVAGAQASTVSLRAVVQSGRAEEQGGSGDQGDSCRAHLWIRCVRRRRAGCNARGRRDGHPGDPGCRMLSPKRMQAPVDGLRCQCCIRGTASLPLPGACRAAACTATAAARRAGSPCS